MAALMHGRRLHAAWLLLLWALALPAQPQEPLEYAVKAAYLVKFPFYVEWPAPAFATPASPLALCIVGDDPFGRLIDDAAAGQQVHGRPIVVRRLASLPRDAGCHIAFLGSGARAESLRGSPTLVVTDAAGNGGTINFVLSDNRVRFVVDDEAAGRNGLVVSSKLLNVALAVKPRATTVK